MKDNKEYISTMKDNKEYVSPTSSAKLVNIHEEKIGEVDRGSTSRCSTSRCSTSRWTFAAHTSPSGRFSLGRRKTKTKENDHHGEHVVMAALPRTWTYTFTWIIDAIVMTLLKYVFCVVGAIIIHTANPIFEPYLGLGIGVQLVSTLITCIITSWRTKIGINIAGPDIIASIFGALWVTTLCDMGLPIETALPTLLFLIFLSTLLMGLIWLYIGYKRITRIISVLPQPVVSGFLGCVGWKVLKYSWKVSMGPKYTEWLSTWSPWGHYMPAVLLGVPLYVLKKKHIVSPMIILPCFLFLPLILFYSVVIGTGTTLDDLRRSNWLVEKVESENFYDLYSKSYGQMQNVSIAGIIACLSDMIVMIIILVIDSLLKLAATKSGLMIDVDMVHEITIAGYENVLTAFFLGSPGYPQVKFNLLSYGILGNTLDRRIGYVMGIACGVMWVADVHAVNLIPRFYMGFLLVYACLPFIMDNLVMTYFRMSKKEFASVWCIVLTAIIADVIFHSPLAMLLAVVVGMLLAFVSFVVQYARVSVVHDVFTGETYQSRVIRSYWEEALLSRVGKRVSMIKLEGFIFFASSTEIKELITKLIDESKSRPGPSRLRYLLLDFEHVSNIDFSAIRNFVEIKRILKMENVYLMLTGLTEEMHAQFSGESIFTKGGAFPCVKEKHDMDVGTEEIEDMILERAAKLRTNWLLFESLKKIHMEAQLKKKFEVFDMALGGNVGHDLYMYAQPQVLKPGVLICEEGKVTNTLYLLQRGRVTSWTSTDDDQLRRVRSMRQGAVINDECVFLDLPVAYSCVVDKESVVWAISQNQFRQMELRSPKLFLKIHVYILRYASLVRHKLELEMNNIDHAKKANTSRQWRKTHLALDPQVMKKIRTAHTKYRESEIWSESHATVQRNSRESETLIEVDGGHHTHHFEHISTVKCTNAKLRNDAVRDVDPKWKLTKPHLSSVVFAEATKWFEFHAEEVDQSDIVTCEKKLDVGNVQKALMDLGLFPTLHEIRTIHSRFKSDSVKEIDETEFINIVKFLTLTELSNGQLEGLHILFMNHAKKITNENDGTEMLVVTRDELKSLMAEIGHPEDKVELDCIMHEWDLDSKGYLVFDSFISVIATFMKIESQDIEIEVDFLRLCGLTDAEIKLESVETKKHRTITKRSLLKGIEQYSPKMKKITPETVEEMIWDADLDRVDQQLTIDEFITAIEMVGPKEIDALAPPLPIRPSIWMLPSGSHLSPEKSTKKLGLKKKKRPKKKNTPRISEEKTTWNR